MVQDSLLDASTAAFIEGAVSIIVASRDARHTPDLVRALGARVAEDRSRVTVFIAATQAAAVLADVRANGTFAAVFSQPSTHRTVQLKAADARLDAVDPGDLPRLAQYREGMVRELGMVGQPPDYTRALLAFDPADLVAVTFTPTSAFSQTPGPNAGAPLRSAP